MSLRKLYYFFPPSLRLILRRLIYYPIDLFEKISGKRDKLTPPRGLLFIGSGDFRKTGEELLKQIIEMGDLKPNHRVLDVGCGIGRLAVPLTRFLDQKGSYEGFDIVKTGIEWCNKNIRSNHPNFNFIHNNLKNDLYNLSTDKEAKNFIFPYKDGEFDFIILTSVFTHMMPEDLDNYLFQIQRTLKQGGKCFATFFLLNTEIKKMISTSDGLNFPYDFGNYRLVDKNVKEANIAFELDFFNKMITKNKLSVETIEYGWWPGRAKENHKSFQDIVLLSKLT